MKIVIFSGAGVSKESGIDTYRDEGGIWERYDQNKVCTLPAAFDHRQESFKFFNECLAHFKDAKPNAAHLAAAALQEKLGKDVVTIITQNVDMLFEQAGCEEVVHLHGHLDGYLCHDCNVKWPREEEEFDPEEKCPDCGDSARVKCDAVMFGENAPEYARLYNIKESLTKDDYLVCIGTSFQVVGAEMLFNHDTFQSPKSININPDGLNPSMAFGINLAVPAAEGFPGVAEQIANEAERNLTASTQTRSRQANRSPGMG